MIDLKLDLKFFQFEIKLNIFETLALMVLSTVLWAIFYAVMHKPA